MIQYNLSGKDYGFSGGVSFLPVVLYCFSNRSVLQIILFTEYVVLSALKDEIK